MRKKLDVSLSFIFCFWLLFMGVESFSQPSEFKTRDLKRSLFIFIFEQPESPPVFSKNLKDLRDNLNLLFDKKGNEIGIERLIFEAQKEKKYEESLAKEMLGLSKDKLKNVGGIIQIQFEKINETVLPTMSPVTIELYHYPFPPIAEEHIKSPEYTFKFGSDSALLSISLFESFKSKADNLDLSFSNGEIMPAVSVNPYLSEDLLRSFTKITIKSGGAYSTEQIKILAQKIFNAISSYYQNDKSYMIGVLPEKVQKRCKPENIEIQIFKYNYPDKEPSEKVINKSEKKDEQTQPEIIVKPFQAFLFYIGELEKITPYTYKVIDITQKPDSYWREVWKGEFLTSDLKGVARTIPNKIKNYIPLENKYSPQPETIEGVKEMDYVIEGATIIDGTNKNPKFVGDVGILGERIFKIGNLKGVPRKETVKGNGLFLTPGFIDIHSHVDWSIFRAPFAQSCLNQGVTSCLGGNCASSPLGIGTFYSEVESSGTAINIGVLIGNRPVREKVWGKRTKQPEYADVYREKELIDLGMEEGAFGMSTGLIYLVSEDAYTWEIAEMAKQLKPYGGFYATHCRGESEEVLDSIREAIYIGEIAEVPVQISHIKVIGKENWGDMKRFLEIIKSARKRGLDVTGDQYPWRATGPSANYKLLTLLEREAIKDESPEVVLLKEMPDKYKKYTGKLLSELLENEKITPEDLIVNLNLKRDSKIYAAYLCLSEEDLILPMSEDFVMVCTDASLKTQKEIDKDDYENEHPRRFSTYPEFLSKYVRDKGVCSWELGIYKCTGLPAWRMKLDDRGVIKEGAYADLVLFDPQKIESVADYIHQNNPPKGIHWVFINGKPALKDSELTKIRNGKALRAYGNRKP